jgi:hypothetical protein
MLHCEEAVLAPLCSSDSEGRDRLAGAAPAKLLSPRLSGPSSELLSLSVSRTRPAGWPPGDTSGTHKFAPERYSGCERVGDDVGCTRSRGRGLPAGVALEPAAAIGA